VRAVKSDHDLSEQVLTPVQTHITQLRSDLEQAREALDLVRASRRLTPGMRARVELAARGVAEASQQLENVQRLLSAAAESPVASRTPECNQPDPPIRLSWRQRPLRAPRLAPVLTPREAEVATLLARGLTNKEIGVELVISTATARVHVEHIMAKLEIHARAQVAIWAAQ
jgi:DNA-binding NarL/FixJ family response regulator